MVSGNKSRTLQRFVQCRANFSQSFSDLCTYAGGNHTTQVEYLSGDESLGTCNLTPDQAPAAVEGLAQVAHLHATVPIMTRVEKLRQSKQFNIH